jgi:hypothetical protein
MQNNYKAEPVLLFTENEIIDGILCRPSEIRLSDVLNATAFRGTPFLGLRNARVISRTLHEEIFNTEFIMVARERITYIMPKANSVINWEALRSHESQLADTVV